jgi:hypothetical protein
VPALLGGPLVSRFLDDPPDDDGTSVFVQWKGTDVCLDFRCTCGWDGHFDGYFAYVVRCGGCDALWEMPHYLVPRKTTGTAHTPVDPEP